MRIICVDDEALVLQLTASLCRKLPQVDEVEAFDSAQAALDWIKENDADIALLEIDMPNMDGIEMIKQIRQTEGYKFTPIIALTTENQDSKMQEGKAAGATGWIVKPFTSEKLLALVKKIIG